MATKKQLSDLEEQNSILRQQLQERDNEIVRLSQHNSNLHIQLEHLENLKNHITEERDRLMRAETINKNLNVDLMHAIAVLGHRESNRINSEVWHECIPTTKNYIASYPDDSQKV